MNVVLLAQVPGGPNAVEVAAWIGCLFFLVAGWNQVEQFFDRRSQRGAAREIQPQPLSVAKFDPPVPETLCASRRKEARFRTPAPRAGPGRRAPGPPRGCERSPAED